MSDYGVTPEGFNRKRLDQLLSELNDEVKSIFGDNFNTEPESPDGQINGVISESNANLWELGEEAYNAFNPSAATGVTLSNLVQLNGITRLSATPSRVLVTLTGTDGTIIPADSLVSTSDTGDQFYIEEDTTIDGSTETYMSSVSDGPISAISGTLTSIDTPISGWDTCVNTSDATLGTDEETDVELRARRERSVARDAQAIIDSIYASIANIDGVTETIVLENDTNETDTNGLPPHSFHPIVIGGEEDEIGNAIWLKKPAGILSFGNQETQVTDSQGFPHTISFSRPTTVDVYVEVDLTTFPDYPSDGDELIKQAIVDYANGDLVEGRGFSLGDHVIYTRLYTPINSVQGHEIDALRIGTSPSPTGTENIPIDPVEISNFLNVNIAVNS